MSLQEGCYKVFMYAIPGVVKSDFATLVCVTNMNIESFFAVTGKQSLYPSEG